MCRLVEEVWSLVILSNKLIHPKAWYMGALVLTPCLVQRLCVCRFSLVNDSLGMLFIGNNNLHQARTQRSVEVAARWESSAWLRQRLTLIDQFHDAASEPEVQHQHEAT